jgi:hypothetical protein
VVEVLVMEGTAQVEQVGVEHGQWLELQTLAVVEALLQQGAAALSSSSI